MARPPDGVATREVSMTTRITPADLEQVDHQMRARGYSSRSGYIRWLIREDGKRMAGTWAIDGV